MPSDTMVTTQNSQEGLSERPASKLRISQTPTRRKRMHSVIQEIVDPSICRMWCGQNRAYGRLNAVNCRDLIESFEGHGQQEVPAIVRRVTDTPGVSYEVICGARRHWAASFLRRNGRPQFGFLVEPRELTDEEAFRLADLENRSRRDLSTYERAADYIRALETIYDGHQGRLAAALNMADSNLSRLLEVARLPPEIYNAFGSPHEIGVSHAAILAPLLRVTMDRERVLAATISLAAEQGRRLAGGKRLVSPAEVMKALLGAPSVLADIAVHDEYRDERNRLVARAERSSSGDIAISVPGATRRQPDQVLAAVHAVVERLLTRKDVEHAAST